jgi:hypothetical protein
MGGGQPLERRHGRDAVSVVIAVQEHRAASGGVPVIVRRQARRDREQRDEEGGRPDPSGTAEEHGPKNGRGNGGGQMGGRRMCTSVCTFEARSEVADLRAGLGIGTISTVRPRWVWANSQGFRLRLAVPIPSPSNGGHPPSSDRRNDRDRT